MTWEGVPEDHRALAFLNLCLLIMVMLTVISSTVVVFLHGGPVLDYASAMLPSFFVALALSFALVLIPSWLFDRKVAELKARQGKAEKKINTYKHWSVQQMICYMVPSVIGMAGFIMFGNYLFYICIGISLLSLILRFPSFNRLNDLARSGTYW